MYALREKARQNALKRKIRLFVGTFKTRISAGSEGKTNEKITVYLLCSKLTLLFPFCNTKKPCRRRQGFGGLWLWLGGVSRFGNIQSHSGYIAPNTNHLHLFLELNPQIIFHLVRR